jgi:hypothetical protein
MKTRKASRGSTADYVIAIPSYKRAETLRDKTLALLKSYGIDHSKIHIFVANKQEAEDYKRVLDPDSYGKLIVGVLKIGPQRNFILNYFPIGKPIVQMDDDIRELIEYDPSAKRHERKLKSLKTVIEKGFQLCKEHSCRYWGIYPTANGFFMKSGFTTDLRFIIGVMTGCFNPGTKGPKGLRVQLSSFKEDYERTIKMFKMDGAVIRFSDVAPKTSYYTEKGGAEEFRDTKGMEEEARWLEKHFPEFVQLRWIKRPRYSTSKLYPDVRLKDTRTTRRT